MQKLIYVDVGLTFKSIRTLDDDKVEYTILQQPSNILETDISDSGTHNIVGKYIIAVSGPFIGCKIIHIMIKYVLGRLLSPHKSSTSTRCYMYNHIIMVMLCTSLLLCSLDSPQAPLLFQLYKTIRTSLHS